MYLCVLVPFVLINLAYASTTGTDRIKCLSTAGECWPDEALFRSLGEKIVGDVVLPGDKAWEDATHLLNPRLRITPGAVIMAKSTDDIIAAVKVASMMNLDVSIKSSGHCFSGNCMKEGSLHIDLRRMNNISLDKDAMILHVQPGTNFDAMYKMCDDNDVLVVGGMCPTVGPVGFTLGGGHGPLHRSYGLGADNLISAQVVTSKGERITVSETENADLFWAIRGGGGGAFGIVVAMEIRVHTAPPQMVGVSCAWPLSKGGKRVGEPILTEWYGEMMTQMINEWTFYTISMKSPINFILPRWNAFTMNGLLNIEGVYNGPYDQKMLDSIQPLLNLGKEHQLKCKLTKFDSFRQWHDHAWFGKGGPVPFRSYMSSSFGQPDFDRKELAQIVIDTIIELPFNAVNTLFGIQLGGNISRPESKTSVSSDFRSAVLMLETDADWNFAAADKTQIAWVKHVGDSIANVSGFSGSYVNEPDPGKMRGEYEEMFWGNQTFIELQNIKGDWDPDSMFDCHQCVYNP